jgi:outer membrane protein OmpA-like peptidoglycan-associated protein
LTSFNLSSRAVGVLLVAALAGCQTPPPQEDSPPVAAVPKGLNPAQVAVLKQQGFQLREAGWEFDLSNKVLFGNDSATLNANSRGGIERIGRALLGVEIDRLRLEGHTDSVGRPDYNQRLSMGRAQAVAQVLIGIGMPQGNLNVRGLGMTKPVADNKTEAGRQENRRVVIIVPVE